MAIFDPQQPADGDPVFDIPEETGNGIAPWPFAGLGNHPVSIHSFSSQTKGSEGAFNLLYHHIDRNKKWCDDKTTKPWVVFELTDYYNIEKFVFRDVAPYEEGNGNVPEYWLYTSVTGTATGDWKEIAHKTNQASVDVKEVVFVVPEEARYLKLVVSRGTRTDNNNPENAVRIYGCDIYGSFSSKIDRGDLISAGKTVVDYFSAPFYYEAPLHLLDGNKTNNSAKWTFQRPDVIDSLRWVIVDLEDNYNISQFKIYDSHSIGSNTNNISRYNIYLRSSAPDFNLISSNEDRNEGWNQVVSAAGRKSEDIKTDAITPVEGRFVKLEIPRSGISGTTNLYEFEIFGTKATNGISANNPLMKIYAQNSTLFVESAEASAIRIYDVSGRQLRTLTGKSGLTAINGLPAKGLYIVRTDRLTSKITL
ncbi:MAG: discoidin domain-containing protein [Candidatus Symbiothrix sp.]|nr:discoidin domain-containing protein [Candidatus Symbiothrix sp.]